MRVAISDGCWRSGFPRLSSRLQSSSLFSSHRVRSPQNKRDARLLFGKSCLQRANAIDIIFIHIYSVPFSTLFCFDIDFDQRNIFRGVLHTFSPLLYGVRYTTTF